MNYMTFREIAEIIGVSIDTIRRYVKKFDLKYSQEKTSSSKGALTKCLSIDDANLLIAKFEKRDMKDSNTNESALDRFGYFYIIQVIPELLPNRVKIGYTDNLETRLKEHQTSAPTAIYIGHWKCKRSWDQAAMDCITSAV